MLYNLGVVVDISHKPHPYCGDNQQNVIQVGEVAKDQYRYQYRQRNYHSAHRGGPLLAQLPLEAQVADIFPDLFLAELLYNDIPGPKRGDDAHQSAADDPERDIFHKAGTCEVDAL